MKIPPNLLVSILLGHKQFVRLETFHMSQPYIQEYLIAGDWKTMKCSISKAKRGSLAHGEVEISRVTYEKGSQVTTILQVHAS